MTKEPNEPEVPAVPAQLDEIVNKNPWVKHLPVPSKLKAPFTLKLKRPVTLGSETVSEMTFQELRWGMLEDIQLNLVNTSTFLKVAGRLTGQPPAVLHELRMEDAACVMYVVTVFLLPLIPTTGD